MDRKYKPLRPALASQGLDFEREGHGDPRLAQKRKRAQVKVACDTCRAKKSACDGQRPVCAACVRRGSPCTFSGRVAEASDSPSSQTPITSEAGRHTSANELLSLLTSATPEAAQDLLADIKVYGDFSLALAHLRGREQFEKDGRDLTLAPPEQGSVEFELMVRHPVLYPSAAPLDLPLDPTLVVFQKSQKFESGAASPSQKSTSPFNVSSIGTPDAQLDPSSNQQSLSVTPILADNRLEIVNFANWTHVSIDNFEAANAVSRYIEIDHPILGLFDVELFLDDLCSYETRFCSELLVNSLLSWACLDPSVLIVTKADVSRDFFSEATKQLSAESDIDSITKLVALELLSLTASMLGLGDQGRHLLEQAIAMGSRMGLQDDPTLLLSDLQELRAASHCAWGLFSYATLYAFQSQRSDLRIRPPKVSIPQESVAESMPIQLPHHSPVFANLCQLWVMVNEILCQYFPTEPAPNNARFDRNFVTIMLGRLLTFGDQLPLSLARGSKANHSALILHMMTHSAIIALLRPLVLDNDTTPLDLEATSASPAQEVSAASSRQLRRCLSIYQQRFTARASPIFWHTGSLFVANHAIRSTDHQRDRADNLRLALDCYKTLYPQYPIALVVAKGLLAMAAAAHLTTPQEAYDFIRQLRSKDPRAARDSPTRTAFVVDLDMALSDHESAHIDCLAQRFDDMIMFDEFTHGRVDLDGVDIR